MAQRYAGPAPRKQEAVASSNSAFQASQQQQQQHPRSNPIAIRRRKLHRIRGEEDQSFGSSSSSDNEDSKQESISNNYMQQSCYSHTSDIRDSETSHSLPTALLLRAPKLGSSVPNEEEELPVLKLTEPQLEDDPEGGTEADKTEMSYGSLRESQLEGRFLQRPRSYYHRPENNFRNSSSQMENAPSTSKKNVRFQMASSAPTTFTGLSIGERIQQSRQQQKQQLQQEQEQKKPHSISSLSAMLQASSVHDASTQDLAQTFQSNDVFRTEISTTMENCLLPEDHWTLNARNRCTNNDDEAMLSTSLTGLEVLQRGLADRSLSSSFRSGTNAINHALARSYSDPVPSQRRTDVPRVNFLLPPASASSTTTQSTSTTTTSTALSSGLSMLARRDEADERFVVTTRNSSGTVPPRYCSAFGMLTLQSLSTPSGFASSGLMGSSLLQLAQPSQATSVDQAYQNSTDLDFDPDNEGAFDMDME